MIEKLQNEYLKNKDMTAAFILSEPARKYFTGFSATEGSLIITSKSAYLMVDFRYAEAARSEVKNCEIVECSDPYNTLKKVIEEENIKSVALEYNGISLMDAMHYKDMFKSFGAQVDFSDELENEIKKLRMIKTQKEIDNIISAQKITDETFSYILGEIKEGITEKEIAAKMEYKMRLLGAEGCAFDTIVVSGTNGSRCHGVPSLKKVEKGDFITMDFGALYNGYRSDMTRTVALSSVSDEQKAAYEIVLSAQLKALSIIKAGENCFMIDKEARDIIEKDYKGKFGHGLGHSVGIDIHEHPRFSPSCNENLKAGMIMTVEPGIYIEGKFGLRIEDMVLVTENGCDNLTKSPKNLIIV